MPFGKVNYYYYFHHYYNKYHFWVKMSPANYARNLSTNLEPIEDTENLLWVLQYYPTETPYLLTGKHSLWGPSVNSRGIHNRTGRLLKSAQFALVFNTWLGLNPTLNTRTSRNSGISFLYWRSAELFFNYSISPLQLSHDSAIRKKYIII